MIWHGSLFTGPNRWYNIGGTVLAMGHWNAGYIRNFPLLPFEVPIAPTVLGVGDPPTPSLV